jgi:hypothetical protein
MAAKEQVMPDKPVTFPAGTNLEAIECSPQGPDGRCSLVAPVVQDGQVVDFVCVGSCQCRERVIADRMAECGQVAKDVEEALARPDFAGNEPLMREALGVLRFFANGGTLEPATESAPDSAQPDPALCHD